MAATVANAAFDPAPKRLGTVLNMIAGEAILAGDVVGFAGTGVAWTVLKHKAGTTVCPIGVALYSAASGAKVAVASVGSIIKVKNGYDAALEAGDSIQGSAAIYGNVLAFSDAADSQPIGFMLEALPGDTTPAYAYINGGVPHAKGS